MTFEPEQALRLHCLAGSNFRIDQWRGAMLHHWQPFEGQQDAWQVMSSCLTAVSEEHAKAHVGVIKTSI